MPPAIPRPTMRDVARLAGTSLKTVSRVVNDEVGVSPELTARVEEAVATLGFRPDERARRLRQSTPKTSTIGFILVDVANPFFSAILRGIEDVAAARNVLVLSGSTDRSIDRERQLIEAFVDRRVDGFIVAASDPAIASLLPEMERGTPVVFVDLEPDIEGAVDLVRSDHFGGGRTATAHLVDSGHRHIAFLGDDPRIFSARLRFDGYRAALADARIEPGQTVAGSFTADEWRSITVDLMTSDDDPPTALFTAQNFATMGAVHALHGLELQHRIGLVGFDDIEMAEVLDPGVTVVPQRPDLLGRSSAELLFDRLDGDTRPAEHIVLAQPIIERGSGEIRPTQATSG